MNNMENLDRVYEKCTLEYFQSGEYKISLEEFLALKKEGKAVMLDMRTPEEAEIVSLSFAYHMPVSELPARIGELPEDKMIVPFCASSVRAVMAFVYLKAAGFDNVKIFMGKLDDLTANFMPPFIAANYDTLKSY